MAPYLSNDTDTSEEEEQVVKWLNENGGTVTRIEVNSKLKEKFERMKSPPMITKLYSSAAAKGSFFVERNSAGQMVGLTKSSAKYALLIATTNDESDSSAPPCSGDDGDDGEVDEHDECGDGDAVRDELNCAGNFLNVVINNVMTSINITIIISFTLEYNFGFIRKWLSLFILR